MSKPKKLIFSIRSERFTKTLLAGSRLYMRISFELAISWKSCRILQEMWTFPPSSQNSQKQTWIKKEFKLAIQTRTVFFWNKAVGRENKITGWTQIEWQHTFAKDERIKPSALINSTVMRYAFDCPCITTQMNVFIFRLYDDIQGAVSFSSHCFHRPRQLSS